MNKALLESKNTECGTPQWLFDLLNMQYNFDVDVCANIKNAKCDIFITEKMNALNLNWSIKENEITKCWMNPPYGSRVNLFVKKAYEQSFKKCVVVCLLAARTDTRWFWEYCSKAYKIELIKGRLKFVNGNYDYSAPFPSCVVIFNEYAKQEKGLTEPIIEWVDYRSMKNG